MLADLIEDADEAALIAREDVDQTRDRSLERADETGEEFDFRGKRGQLGNALGIDDVTVDIRGFDFNGLVRIAERLEGFGRGDGIFDGLAGSGTCRLYRSAKFLRPLYTVAAGATIGGGGAAIRAEPSRRHRVCRGDRLVPGLV